MTFTNLFLPTDSLFLAVLLVKQYIKLEWPKCVLKVLFLVKVTFNQADALKLT